MSHTPKKSENGVTPLSDAESVDTIKEKMSDAMTPGYQVEFDPGEAEGAGAFIEDALSENEALEASADLFEETPIFTDDSGPSDLIPTHILTKTDLKHSKALEDKVLSDAGVRKEDTGA